MTLDRTTTPPVGTFPPLSLPAPGIHALSNGIEIIACNRGDEDVCRIDLIFEGGYYTEQKPGTAALTLLMLKEGAAGKSSEEIAESFDYHGAWLQTSASSHYLYVTLYTLNRHLDTCLSLLADIVIRPDFPEKEFTRLKERRLQQLLVQKEKVDVLASETFLSMIFGDKHRYSAIFSVRLDSDKIRPAPVVSQAYDKLVAFRNGNFKILLFAVEIIYAYLSVGG